MPLNIGGILHNRYRIDSLIAEGGMGAVYRATDLNLGIAVVVKENLLHSAEARQQFGREASILAGLRHPNLPRVSDHFFIPGQGQYLVMDHIEGDDLNEIIARQGAIPEAQALAWIRQVVDALAYLHSQWIIHRDVKPANVKITPRGQVYLVDFGLAKVDDANGRTGTGARGLTPGYAPPEQYGQGRTDARSDVYGTGATLYTALTGQAPPDSVDLMMGTATLRPPRQVEPAITPQTEKAVRKAMASRPTDRYQSAAELGQALSKPVAASRRRLPLAVWILAAALAVVLLALGAWQVLGSERGGSPAPAAAALATGTRTPAPAPTSTATPLPTAASLAAPTPLPAAGRTPTSSPTPTGTPTDTPTGTPTLPPTETPSPTVTPSLTVMPSPTPLTPPPPPPARNRIAFASPQGGTWDLYTISPDGGNVRRLTTSPANERSPAWSPDGSRIAFVAEQDGAWAVYVMDAGGGNVQHLADTDNLGYDCWLERQNSCDVLAWSPDGQRIAFYSFGIWVMNADGSNRRLLMEGSHHPTWSPDGQQIAFDRGVSENQVHHRFLYTIDPSGGNERSLTYSRLQTGTQDSSPAWSPDGRQIVFDSNGDGIWGIYVVDAEGGHPRRLTNHGGRAASEPAWSSDGRRIVFTVDGWQAPGGEIYVMDADGSNIQYLTQGVDPAWSP